MNIKGFQKTSLLDYPNKVATTIFTGGCNFRCPYCHNGDLVLNANNIKSYDESDIINHIKKRKKVLDGICITGGEPTLQKDLKSFIMKVKEIGINVKLDTNGYNPELLQQLINENLLDYIAMDIKNSKAKYSITTGVDIDIKKIEAAVNIIMTLEVDYEFRTTVIKELHEPVDFESIGIWLKGAKSYYLQQYTPSDKQVKNEKFTAYLPDELEQFKNIMRKYIEEVEIRGI